MSKKTPIPASVSIISKEIMTYKEQIKTQELFTKIRIIRAVRKDHIPVVQVSHAYGCHRNTVDNTLRVFDKRIPEWDRQTLITADRSCTQIELVSKYAQLLNTSRKPKSHKKAATEKQEKYILGLFQEPKMRIGVTRMTTMIKRKHTGTDNPYGNISQGQIRGIYRRNNLTVRHVRSSNGERRKLYDYTALSCFSRLHYDVKHILDKHALPESIYKPLSSKNIPQYEWNIIDARSKFRLIAYSHEITAEFGQQFLLFAIHYLRASLIAYDIPILVGVDNGSEFCSGSKRKEQELNELLSCVNAQIYAYEPRFDIRRNLIERSHLSDDEELYIPRGEYMGTKETFRQEVTDYVHYWNYLRPHFRDSNA